MRRRPTLPHTFAYSTIGPAGLNFRVRDGNGWNPRGKITANSSALSRGQLVFGTWLLALYFQGRDNFRPLRLNQLPTTNYQLLILSMRGHQSGSTVFLRAKDPSQLEESKLLKDQEDDASQLNRLSFHCVGAPRCAFRV